MLEAIVAFALLTAALAAGEAPILAALREPAWAQWLAEHVLIPLGRAVCVLAFIALGYPDVFGLADAPALSEVLAGPDRTTDLVNLAFVLSLALPLLPLAERVPAVVLPIQGLCCMALVFGWAAAAMAPGLDVSRWPDTATWLAIAVAAGLPALLGWHQPDTDHALAGREAGLIALQIPPLLLYGQQLGAQLVGAVA